MATSSHDEATAVNSTSQTGGRLQHTTKHTMTPHSGRTDEPTDRRPTPNENEADRLETRL